MTRVGITRAAALFRRLLAFLFGDGARLDSIDLGLIQFDQDVVHVLNFARVVVRTEQRIGVAAAGAQRRRMRFENHRGLLAAVPSPVHLVARDAHDVAGLAAVAAAVDEEIDFTGDNVVYLLAIVYVRTG